MASGKRDAARFRVRTTFDPLEMATESWETHVVLFAAGALPAFSQREVFAAACAAARAHRRASYPPQARPPVQVTCGRSQLTHAGPLAPSANDRSFAGYEARMRRRGAPYALVIADLHRWSFPLWAREQAFVSQLWRHLGLPLSGAITTLFHGDYEHTPVGVHRDRFGTFLFLLRGRKRMRFWAERPWSEPVTTKLDYREHLSTSFAVEMSAGEVLYWPSRYYHVGESADAAPATSVNLGLPIAQHHTSYYLDDLALGTIDEFDLSEQARASTRLRSKPISPLVRGAPTQGGRLATALPAPLAEAIAAYRRLAEPGAARRHLRTTWLRRMSAAGLEPAPNAAPRRRLRPRDRIRRDPRFPLFWSDAGGVITCAGNGHVFEIEHSAAVVRLVRALAEDTSEDLATWLADLPAASKAAPADRLPATRAGARSLIEQLLAARVLRRATKGRP